ncbi:hypothetical protein O1L60_31010 [Streptomyces diastatochromogenes]|nr:hypothetical protein [Streptomyces diastatochromogenes]
MTVPAAAPAPNSTPNEPVLTVPVVPEEPTTPLAEGRFTAEDLEKVRREERESCTAA